MVMCCLIWLLCDYAVDDMRICLCVMLLMMWLYNMWLGLWLALGLVVLFIIDFQPYDRMSG